MSLQKYTWDEFKEIQKQLAEEIKLSKSKRKSSANGYDTDLQLQRSTYRHQHIAYCLVRGTPIEKIEIPHVNNPYDTYRVEILMRAILPKKNKEETDE